MLDFAEEIVLLQLDYAETRPIDLPLSAFEIVIAGAAVMELALRNRLDADLDRFFLIDQTPTGDAILDDALLLLDRAGAEFGPRTALECTSDHADAYRQMALQGLIAKGIIVERESGRYAIIDHREERELKDRLRQELLTDEIPDPNNVMLICLVEAAGLIGQVLTADEVARTRARVEQISRLDLIGHAIAWAVADMRFIVRH
ncbi:MAG TPA: GPP34 family phosphoprotein [Stellaceae bacterium]|jgi:hypothetical protein|nr:GPP34 family phosphoprotein [Stellaceae bacterium]